MPGALVEKRKMAVEWFGMTPEERLRAGLPPDQTALRRYLKVGSTAMKEWQALFLERKNREIIGRTFEPEEESPDEVQAVLEALRKMAIDGKNAFAAKTFLQAKGVFVEKTESKVIHELSADEIARRNLEADRELREWRRTSGQGMEKVPKEPPLLSQ